LPTSNLLFSWVRRSPTFPSLGKQTFACAARFQAGISRLSPADISKLRRREDFSPRLFDKLYDVPELQLFFHQGISVQNAPAFPRGCPFGGQRFYAVSFCIFFHHLVARPDTIKGVSLISPSPPIRVIFLDQDHVGGPSHEIPDYPRFFPLTCLN